MADLSKTVTPDRSRRRLSDNQTYLGPSQRDTRGPSLEVNAPLVGPNASRAQALMDILNVGAKAGQEGLDFLEQRDAEKRALARTAGAKADQMGTVDEQQLAKNRAYAQGYYLSGAQRTLIQLETSVKQKVQDRLNDENLDPATPQDIHDLINEEFKAVAMNPDGTARTFGDPLADEAMVNGLSKIRAGIMPAALDKIKEQTDDHLIGNVMFNLAHGVGLVPLGQKGADNLKLSSDALPHSLESVDPNTGLSGGNVMGYAVVTNPDKSTWDKRADGSTKGMGWLGLLRRPDGGVSSEISVGVEINGKEQEIPLMVPGLSKSQLDYLMTHDPSSKSFQKNLPNGILKLAVSHAKERLAKGLSPFRQDNEPPSASPTAGMAPSQSLDAIWSKQLSVEGGTNPDGSFRVSPKGAIGPAQLLLGTARDTAQKHGIPFNEAKLRSDAAYNTNLGRLYMEDLVQRYNGNVTYAAAAYNAGPGRVDKAIKAGKDWRSKLPAETKKYLKATVGETDQAGTPLVPVQPPAAVITQPYDFEPIMAQKPPGMDPKVFKTKAIDALKIYADEANRPDILEGIAMSTRKDGTPSFSPEEINTLRDEADSIRTKHYREAQLAERQKHEANEDLILQGFATGNEPSISTIQDWTAKGLISPRFGYTMVDHVLAQQHQDEVEQRAEERLAKADAENDADNFATAEIVSRQYGNFENAEDPLALYNSGKLGAIGSKSALRRLTQIRAANKAGADLVEKSPLGTRAVSLVDQAFPTKEVSGPLAAAGIIGQQGSNNLTLRASVFAALDEEIQKGTPPIEAAHKVIKQWSPLKMGADERDRNAAAIKALEAKAAQP